LNFGKWDFEKIGAGKGVLPPPPPSSGPSTKVSENKFSYLGVVLKIFSATTTGKPALEMTKAMKLRKVQ